MKVFCCLNILLEHIKRTIFAFFQLLSISRVKGNTFILITNKSFIFGIIDGIATSAYKLEDLIKKLARFSMSQSNLMLYLFNEDP